MSQLVNRRDSGKMVSAVEYLRVYWETYPEQTGYEKYSISTLIDDAIYVLGMAIDDKQFRNVDGSREFKRILIEHLRESLNV